ncbi:MAG: lysophospholipid acyltransferase family protein [Thermoanaerobacteraceae bacterium]|nr:lysophospholipid acyltransferase family protein [Thermoanaerobacteraceae bacterium]
MFYALSKFFVGTILRILYRIEIIGLENIPKEGGCIISPNHKSNIDPPLVACFLNRTVYYMAKQELFDNKLFAIILKALGAFPVKRGTSDISSIKTSMRLLKEGKALGIFPEGTRSKNGKLGEAEPGVAMLAIKMNVPVIPVAIIGNYKLFSKITIKIGKPCYFDEYINFKLSTEDYKSISQKILYNIQALMEER